MNKKINIFKKKVAMFIVCVLFFTGCSYDENNGNEKTNTKTISGIECVFVEAGTFIMGSPITEFERNENETQHRVTLTKGFWISKYSITNAQYGNQISGKEKHPAVNVGWEEADTWVKSKGGFLPTEAQWEFAARGGNKSKGYVYSGSNNLDEVAWDYYNSNHETQPVGQKNPNELGIYDMSGNVWEWCNDYYGSYPGTVNDPAGPSSGSNRVIRGGSFRSHNEGWRVAVRHAYNNGTSDIGFRIVFNSKM